MKRKIILFVVVLAVWFLLSGQADLQHLSVGVIIAALVAFLTGDLFVQRPHLLLQASRYLWFLYYVPIFLWACIKANIDVARRVLGPTVAVNPGIVKVKTTLKSDIGLTFLANSITLTPGTLCVDVDRDKGFLYVHWIDVKTTDVDKATEMIVHRFEKILKRVFE